MQVNLLSASAAAAGSRIGDLLPVLPGSSPVQSLRGEEDELRARVRRDEEKEAAATATLLPRRPAEVINEAERKIERMSRAFRRRAARGEATRRFREEREAFRRALADAKGRGARSVPRGAGHSSVPDAAKTQPRTSAGSQVEAAAGRRSGAPDDSTKPGMTRGVLRPGSVQTAVSASLKTGVRCSAGGAAATSAAGAAAPNVLLAAAMRAGAGQGGDGTGRVVPPPAAQAGNAAGGGAKASGGLAGVTLPATRPARPGPLAPASAGATRPAGTADWSANVQRSVRVVLARISAERSRTVLRLEPPELGRLRLQMDLRNEVLTLRIDTSTELAHRLLSKDVDRLREGLEASGVQLERVEVRPPARPPASEQRDAQQAGTEQEPQGKSAGSDVEHPAERGRDSHPRQTVESVAGGADREAATESLVDVVA